MEKTMVQTESQRKEKAKCCWRGSVRGCGQLTSHPPVLFQLPGGYKYSDFSVSPVPKILHCHGNTTAGEEVLEAVPVGW